MKEWLLALRDGLSSPNYMDFINYDQEKINLRYYVELEVYYTELEKTSVPSV